MDAAQGETRRTRARTWFEQLRDEICTAFEAIEDELPASAPFANLEPGRFVRKAWKRTDHTGAPGGGGVSPSQSLGSRPSPENSVTGTANWTMVGVGSPASMSARLTA